MEEKYKEFTWIPIYKKIVAWLADKQPKQEMLIGTLEAIGITGFNDYDTDDQRIKLNQIDPFTFLSFLNKYGDAKRLDLLRKLAGKIEVENSLIEELKDVNGLPAVNAMKVWLFP
ncbi:MAG: FRG domain-containing protein, partial [Mucinivorans sp.]